MTGRRALGWPACQEPRRSGGGGILGAGRGVTRSTGGEEALGRQRGRRPITSTSTSDWRDEADALRIFAPRHILFLCVANSARSQMAEGIARSLAPAGVRISSAGSQPSSVRPEAVSVLAEIGVDIGGQRSKGVDEVERPVDAVITLCAEEVCPLWLEPARRLHWALPDPAGVEGSPEARLEAFRSVRDELRRRLAVLFG